MEPTAGNQGNPRVIGVWYVEPDDGQDECVVIEVLGTGKRFTRVFPLHRGTPGVDLSWTLPPTAVQLHGGDL